MTEHAGQEAQADAEAARVVGPRRLTALLSLRHPGVEVSAVEVLSETEGSASRLQLALEYASGADAGLPTTMFLKRNLARFNFPEEMYSTEVRIYRDVLPLMDLEQPAAYAIEAAGDDVHFTILMEDLSRRPGARLGIVTEPTTPDEVDSVLDTVARLHATWWGAPRVDQLPWLTPPAKNSAMRFWGQIGPRLVRRHMRSGHRAGVVDEGRWPEDRLWPAFERLVHTDGTGTLTLLHGDVHAGNVYYVAGSPGGLLDWQLSLRGSWALDVTYLLITALTPDDRRAHERELLARYLDRLGAAGIDPPGWDEAWTRYRQNVLYGILMWLITPDGVHTDEAQLLNLERCVTAGEELDTLAALA
jgi:aminoglycoside phosphotransferase (APT) family kinase protein